MTGIAGGKSNVRLLWQDAQGVPGYVDVGNLISCNFMPGAREPKHTRYLASDVSDLTTAPYKNGSITAVVNSVLFDDVSNPHADSHRKIIERFTDNAGKALEAGETIDRFELQSYESTSGGIVPVIAWQFDGLIISAPIAYAVGRPSRLTINVQMKGAITRVTPTVI